jgi:hypothetical protein
VFDDVCFGLVKRCVGFTTFEMSIDEIIATSNMLVSKSIARLLSRKMRRHSTSLRPITVRGL